MRTQLKSLLPTTTKKSTKQTNSSLNTEASDYSDPENRSSQWPTSNSAAQWSSLISTVQRPEGRPSPSGPGLEKATCRKPPRAAYPPKMVLQPRDQEEEKKFKTELCKNFQDTGKCKFGKKCKFAHGKDEVQPKSYVGLQYKTKPCEKFKANGFCPYGHRCLYQHDSTQSEKLETFCEKVLFALESSPEDNIRKIICEQQSNVSRLPFFRQLQNKQACLPVRI